jgi:hypothetical protein
MTSTRPTVRADPPAPHPSTETVIFDDTGLSAVVFDLRDQRVHRFNAEAAAVWALCDGQTPASDIGRELNSLFGVPAERIADDVTTALRQFAALGLLADERATQQGHPHGPEPDAIATQVLARPPDP